ATDLARFFFPTRRSSDLVTSAYEILELRLGVSVRLLGSLFFLSLRLLWMAVIIYATISKVLVPLTGLDQAATPWLCALLGVVTVDRKSTRLNSSHVKISY